MHAPGLEMRSDLTHPDDKALVTWCGNTTMDTAGEKPSLVEWTAYAQWLGSFFDV